MQKKTNTQGRIIATLLVSLTFLIALVVFQSSAAQEQPDQIAPLKPPFNFEVDRAAFIASGFPAVPPSATRLLTESFGSGFSPSLGVTGTTTMWRIFTDTGSAANYWARVIPALSSTYADTAWAPCGLCDGSGLDPDNDDYPADMGTWLIYGPVDLKDYYGAEVLFHYLLDAHPAMDGSGGNDYFGAGFSDDGTRFSGFQLTGDLSSIGWQTGTLSINVAGLTNKSSVYIGFYFTSNSDANAGRGVFIDNVSLRAALYKKSYMPVVAKNFAVATPTRTPAPYLYNYTWSVGGENDPDFVAWGQSYTSKSGAETIYEQGLTGGNPGNGMYLYNTRLTLVSMAGPNVSVSGNYEISAQFDVWKGKNNARYGIIFGADANAFGRSGTTPTFNANANYYRFALQFPNTSGDDPADFQLELCNTGDGLNCNKLINRTAIPSGANADGVWDTLKVQRQGNQITIYVNNYLLGSVSNGVLTGTREFGTFIASADVNGPANPLEVDWDNYTVTQLP